MYATNALMDGRELVFRLVDDDENAFCELYAAYRNHLLYFAMKFIRFHEFAGDIFQGAFTAVWQSKCLINPGASFSSYLYTIIRNRILNQTRGMANEDKLKERILSHAVDSTSETNNKILFDDLKDVLSHALKQLTSRQREVFNMSRNLQVSHKEITEVLEVFVNTVQRHISVSLKVTRAYLIKYSSTSANILLTPFCLSL